MHLTKRYNDALSQGNDKGFGHAMYFSQLDKTNKRLQLEVDDINLELDRYRQQLSQMEKKQRQFDKSLADEKIISAKYAEERDAAERSAREKETKAISLQHQCEEYQDKVNVTLYRVS